MAEREPFPRLARLGVGVFAKRSRWHNAAKTFAKPTAPMRATDIANVGDRRAAKLRRPWHAPTRHDKLTLAVGSIANDRSQLVGEDPGEQRQVAGSIIPAIGQTAPPTLALARAGGWAKFGLGVNAVDKKIDNWVSGNSKVSCRLKVVEP